MTNNPTFSCFSFLLKIPGLRSGGFLFIAAEHKLLDDIAKIFACDGQGVDLLGAGLGELGSAVLIALADANSKDMLCGVDTILNGLRVTEILKNE